jgi:hypothetical protein
MKPLDDALEAKFTADNGAGGIATLATGGWFKLFASQGQATGRYIVYREITGDPRYQFGGEACRELRYEMKIYDDVGESWAQSSAITDRLEAILTDGTLSITGWTLIYFRLRRRFDEAEEGEGGQMIPFVFTEWDIKLNKN